jgi:TolA-binding protein
VAGRTRGDVFEKNGCGVPERKHQQDASAGPAERTSNAHGGDDSAGDLAPGGAIESARRGSLWQVPAILLSLTLIVSGMYVAGQRTPTDDFDGALRQIEEFIVQGQLETAEHRLREVVEPNLLRATPKQQARFHSVAGDLIYAFVAPEPADLLRNAQQISEQYRKARLLGAILNPAQIENWANVLIAINDVGAARERLQELEGLAFADDEEMARRNRVLRRIVEHGLRQPNLSYDELLGMLGEYRADQLLSIDDETWAVARQAELRLEAGLAREAVDRLIVDMRRLEARPDALGAPLGEMYTLLGRGFFDQGELERAEYYLRLGQDRFAGPHPVRGDGLVLLGRINVATGNQDDAFETFNEVVRDYVNTQSYLPGLLGRAEVRSVLGDHSGALDDFANVCDMVRTTLPRRDVTPDRVSRSLVDRHDAAIATENLGLGLSYILLAERVYDTASVPVQCLSRIASTSRQIADNLVAEAVGTRPDAQMDIDEIDPAVRRQANVNYKRAGDYYVLHARALAASPTEDQTWADSLWLAADSYDHAGWHDLAIMHFSEYLAGRSNDDPRRAEATFRLAQAQHAVGNHGAALTYYEQVLQEHPRSPYASQSHVPLADCLVALSRQTEGERHLEEVLAGKWFITPEAKDFRESHMTLAKMLYDRGQFVTAIEHLDKVVKRYPDDPRLTEFIFRLADARRAHAADLEAQAQLATARSDQQRLRELRSESLRTAMELFGTVRDAYEIRDVRRLDRLQQTFLRNAYLYRADCAYHLGLYPQAIDLYDLAARKYSDHRVSMTALIQIVNCYHQLGDTEKVRAAHNRALVRLRQLPDASFDDSAALLDRQAWEQWLRNSPLNVASADSPAADMP